jgi:hypothetical protein
LFEHGVYPNGSIAGDGGESSITSDGGDRLQIGGNSLVKSDEGGQSFLVFDPLNVIVTMEHQDEQRNQHTQ